MPCYCCCQRDFVFFNGTATTDIYTLSLHDALPISDLRRPGVARGRQVVAHREHALRPEDRKSTRLNSSHSQISYAVFCLKKKTKTQGARSTTIRYPSPPTVELTHSRSLSAL